MFSKHKICLGIGVLGISFILNASPAKKDYALVDASIARIVGIKTLAEESLSGVALAELSQMQKLKLSHYNHSLGRCGGFELLSNEMDLVAATAILHDLKATHEETLRQEQLVAFLSKRWIEKPSDDVLSSFDQISAARQEEWVAWLSSFETRYHAASNPNRHVTLLKAKLEEMARLAKFPVEISEISHPKTSQKSLRARIVGSQRPNEIVALGGHLDSTSGWFGRGAAPGADDNASGSANVLEAFRIMLSMPQPQRTVEFFWYAAEEVGLVGSADIAQNYKRESKDVVGVLQLDMTLFPGSGPFVLASMEDFTSPWLREILVDINEAYRIGATILSDRCGYGCSDHASWHRQGYPALMPFEASFNQMNKKIHTAQDKIDSTSNFNHSAMFTKIAIAFAWELSNSTMRQPK